MVRKLIIINNPELKDLLYMVTFLTPDYLLIFETGARLFLIGKTFLCVRFINSQLLQNKMPITIIFRLEKS